MKIREVDVLRYLVDLIDNNGETSSYEEPEIQVATVTPSVRKIAPAAATVEPCIDPTEVESPIDRDDVFVPPLQAKIEMMKKMTGVEQKNQDLVDQDDGEPAQIGATPKRSVASSLLAALEDDPFEG